MTCTAEHRPARRQRRFKHDTLVAVDLFSGFGGLSWGIELAGFDVIMAANHNRYKTQVHEANHPDTQHWIADLVDTESSDYHDVRELPAATLLAAGISCCNHSQANTQKAYEQGLSLFDLDDPEFEERVTRSERDRATANCPLHYAAVHHPDLILLECTTELVSWGPQVPGRKYGDGSTYRWWMKQFELLGYKYRVLYLNSMFFGVPQSRDRIYLVFWDRRLPTPDLEHRPHSWCSFCNEIVEALWVWRTGVHRVDAAVADIAAESLLGALRDGAVVGETVTQWADELAAGRPLTLPGIPDPHVLDDLVPPSESRKEHLDDDEREE